MFCHKCGNQLPEDASFCNKCGVKIPTGDATANIPVEAESHPPTRPDEPNAPKLTKLIINFKMSIKGTLRFMVSGIKCDVLVDGNKIGRLSNGENLMYNVTPGKHNVVVGNFKIWLDIPVGNAPITLTTHLDDEGKPQMLCDQSHLVMEVPLDSSSSDAVKFDIRSMWNGFVSDFKEMPINNKVLVTLGGLLVATVFGFLLYFIVKLILSLPIVLLIVAAVGFILYRKYGKGLIAKYDAHFASNTGNSELFRLLAIGGGIAYGILFFFPWVKVVGQDWLSLLGYGSTDGFNPIGLLRLVATVIMGLFNLFGNHIEIESIDPMVIIGIIIFVSVLIAPITSLWGNIKNLFCVIVKHDKSELDSTSGGPLEFIIVYYLARGVIQAYITDATSVDWLGSAAGNLYGNMVELSVIPWVLLLLGFINWYCAKRYICSKAAVLTSPKSPDTPDEGFYNSKISDPFRMTVEDVFTIIEHGTVVTGQIDSGRISIGDEVNIIGKSGNIQTTVVTGIEVSRKALNCAQAGHDVGLLFEGIGKDDIHQGDRLEKVPVYDTVEIGK